MSNSVELSTILEAILFSAGRSMTVEELVKQVAGQIGENVQVRRFTRYTLGEGIEVGKMDFADEVASITAA